MPVHEFGMIDNIENEKNDIGYEPLKYNCISVDDEIVNSLNEHLSIMKTYFHSLKRPEFGLAYCGITIIPPELAIKINHAKEESKHIIHYGV
jgi:hypothetical protein